MLCARSASGGFVEQPEADQSRPMPLRPSHAEFEGRAAIR
jgi:hypothetical protein